MKTESSKERTQQPRKPKPLKRDNELLAMVKRRYSGYHGLSKDDMKRLADAGYICQGVTGLVWEVTPACRALLWEHDPTFMREYYDTLQRAYGEKPCWSEAVSEALRLDLLLVDADGYLQMTARGRSLDGLQMVHALIHPDMPFTTLAVQFHGCARGREAQAMHHALDDNTKDWARMRERILASLTGEERLLVGLPPAEELSESEQQIKDLILCTAEGLKNAGDFARTGRSSYRSGSGLNTISLPKTSHRRHTHKT